jgi:hypothetical protein
MYILEKSNKNFYSPGYDVTLRSSICRLYLSLLTFAFNPEKIIMKSQIEIYFIGHFPGGLHFHSHHAAVVHSRPRRVAPNS